MLRPAVTQHNGPSWSARFKDFEFHTVDGDKGGLGKIGWLEHAVSSVSLRDDQATTVPEDSVGEARSPSWRAKPVIPGPV